VVNSGNSINELDILDIGSGDDPLAGSVDTFDLPNPYTEKCKVNQLTYKGDARDIKSIVTQLYDVVYSSHLLEDFPEDETFPILRQWADLVKVGGLLILLLPDQARYVAYCEAKNELPNVHHSIPHFSLSYIRDNVQKLQDFTPVHMEELFGGGDYNFIVILKKVG
jgi:hypothetical protein